MISSMGFSCASRTHCCFTLVSVFWFTLIVSKAVSQNIGLLTVSPVTTRCGENVTLTCDTSASSPMDLEIIEFSWQVGTETMCKYERGGIDSRFPCEFTNETTHVRLTLSLTNVMPVNEGKYLCKLHSNRGVASNNTLVKVQDCFGVSNHIVNASHVKCSFKGVFPSGVVHWSQGDDNLTDAASTQQQRDQHGLYHVWSTIDKKTGNQGKPYNCSLWIPSHSSYVLVQEVKSSGSVVKMQWICILVEIIMMTFMIERASV